MSHKKPLLRKVGFILITIGAILGILLILVRAVPDLEASLYGFIKFNYPPLRSLSCPMLMTILDREPVTVRLNNPLDKTLSFFVNSQFSTATVFDTRKERLDLQPGETRTLSWEVGEENIDLNNFIFARVFASSASTVKMRESTCGTFVLRVPIKGGPVIYYASLSIYILCAVVGLWLWTRHSDMSDPAVISQSWWMRINTGIIAVGIVASIFNVWLLAILTVVLTLLTLSVYLLQRKN